jgi:hypothetical protein
MWTAPGREEISCIPAYFFFCLLAMYMFALSTSSLDRNNVCLRNSVVVAYPDEKPRDQR